MNRLRTAAVIVLALACASACAPFGARAWSNGGYSADLENPDYGTHDWIAEQALTLQTRDVSFLTGTYHADFLVGTEAPDNPDFIGDTTYHHVYYYSSGSVQDDVSADRADAMYGLALDRLEAGDFSVAAYYIGAMTHYIADMGVFGHTMGADTDWGAEVHHSDYEDEFEAMLGTLTLPSGTALGNASAYDAALALARDTTFGEGDVQPNVWMDDNYDWSDATFEKSALASLYGAVSAVADAINRLLFEASYEPPPEPEPEPTEVTSPSAPTDVEAYLDGANVTLTWAAPSDDGGAPIIEYFIYVSETTDSRNQVATVSSLTLTWTDSSREPGKTYHYWVAARNSEGLSPLSEYATVALPAAEPAEDDGPDLLLAAIISGIVAALASGGALVWRRARKRPGK